MPDPTGRPSENRRVVVCNFAEGTKIASPGARAYVVLPNYGGGFDRLELLIRSRGGRWVRKWENLKRLENFRATTIPPEHPRYGDERLWDYDAETLAAQIAEAKERV